MQGHGKTYVVAQYLCLVGHAKASNTCSFLVYSEETSFKTLKSLARLTGLDAGVPFRCRTRLTSGRRSTTSGKNWVNWMDAHT